MSVGFIEVLMVCAAVVFSLLAHLLVAVVWRSRRWQRRILLAYGLPLCFVIGALTTPPDPLSTIMVAGACVLIYGIAAATVLLLAGRQPA